MPNSFLNIDKLANLTELRYLLLEVLDRKDRIQWYDLSFSCKELSLHFAFSFESSIHFLSTLKIINIHEDKSVKRSETLDFEILKTQEDLGIFLCQQVSAHIAQNTTDLKEINFVRELTNHRLAIDLEKLPETFSFLRNLLFHLGIAEADKSTREIIIAGRYARYFREEFFPVLSGKINPESITPKNAKRSNPPTFFISYSSKDEQYKNELQKHLSGLKNKGDIKDWDGRAILPGEDWDEEIKQKLEKAEVILFLVSSDFMASNYITDVELKKAIERHQLGKIKIIPIIIRPCDFDSLPIKKHQALPDGAKAISTWENVDEAYLNVVTRIKAVLQSGVNRQH